jgi:hypothetical protein
VWRLLLLGLLVLPRTGTAEPMRREASAVRRQGPIAVDGRLDEPAWALAPPQRGFAQREPNPGLPPAFATEFRVLHDDHAIYVGVRAFDPRPDLIRGLLTRRDLDSSSDWISVEIDSYRDRRTAFAFAVNPAGVQRDVLHFNDVEADEGWDAVWEAGVVTDSRGWAAELRIPYSQLRFSSAPEQVWGLQVLRRVQRTQELSAWSPWPRETSQKVSLFGTVSGLRGISPPHRIELLPFLLGGARLYRSADGDPLNNGVDAIGNLGGDFKVGLGSSFTVTGTIYPDFGQVEADPSEVNLSDRETFFPEKRPFFVEATDIFRFPLATGDDAVETLFYTRRIGAPPHGAAAGDYVDAPDTTSIYGAAKLSGKSAGGWSVGLLDAVTGQESATVAFDGSEDHDRVVVEPLTNYAVGRVRKDLREGQTTVGGVVTAVNRSLTGIDLDFLHREAYAGGFEGTTRFGGNDWRADMRLIGSHVRGSPEALDRTQRASQRYYQRPDNQHVDYDPARTSLSGGALLWSVGKTAGGRWRYSTGGDLRSPGFESNDLGFQHNADTVLQWAYLAYKEDRPGDRLQSWEVNSNAFVQSNWAPQYTNSSGNLSATANFDNYWGVHGGMSLSHNYLDWTYLRGGPMVRRDPGVSAWWSGWSDPRRQVSGGLDLNGFLVTASSSYGGDATGSVALQARSNLELSLSPRVGYLIDDNQYVAEVPDTMDQPRYVLGRLIQVTTALTVRASYTWSPALSVQLYAQPFLSAGRFTEYKEAVDPRANDYHDRYDTFRAEEGRDEGGIRSVDRDGDGLADFSFPLSDYNFRELRSTLVMRWQYRPGSALFLIWSHGRTSLAPDGRFAFASDLDGLADQPGEHVLLAKLNFWYGL